MSDDFAALLRRYRRGAGLSQEALAELAGLSKDAISALERGTRRAPYRDTVGVLARGLDLNAADVRAFEEAAARGRAHRGVADEPHPSNLPQIATTLVGRDDVVAELLDSLSRHNLITIVGPGGGGKTRVAIEVAERFRQQRGGGAWFVDLAPVSAEGVLGKVAAALGVTIGAGNARDELTAALRGRHGLVVLDNCEHVIRDAAAIASAVGADCPSLKILATSRERLALHGETVHRLGPLADDAARELFGLRASSAGLAPSLSATRAGAVVEICRHVENMPLGIELAAARAPLLGLSELRARLRGQLGLLSGGERDAPRRHHAMRDTIAWSYDLLDDVERALFRRLAVFAGGWSLDAVAAVAGVAPVPAANVVVAFPSLVEKSLVAGDVDAEPARYRLLEPIRAFALEQLTASGELEEFRSRHAHWIADFADSLLQGPEGIDAADAVAAAVRELDNARGALEWLLHPNGDALVAARIVAGVRTGWLSTGLYAECQRWCELVLANLDLDEHAAAAAEVFRALINSILGNSEQGEAQNRAVLRAIPVLERAGDWSGVASLLSMLAARSVQTGNSDDAEEMFERIERIRHEHGSKPNADWINVQLHRSYAFQLQGQLEKAGAAADEAMKLARDLRLPTREMHASLLAAEIAFALGDCRRAIAITTECVETSRNHRHVVFEMLARSNRAGYHLASGELELARAEARKVLLERGDVAQWVFKTATLHLATASAISGNKAKDAALLKGYHDAHYTKRFEDPSEIASRAMLTSALETKLSPPEIVRLEREGSELSASEAAELALTL